MGYLNFKYGGHCEFKGKSISLPIYEPIDPAFESLSSNYLCDPKADGNKINPPQSNLHLQYNPLVVQREVNLKRYDSKF